MRGAGSRAEEKERKRWIWGIFKRQMLEKEVIGWYRGGGKTVFMTLGQCGWMMTSSVGVQNVEFEEWRHVNRDDAV